MNTSPLFDVQPEHNFLFKALTSSKISSEIIHRHVRNALVKHMRSEVAKCDLEWTLRMLNGLHSNCRIDDLSVRVSRLVGDSCKQGDNYRAERWSASDIGPLGSQESDSSVILRIGDCLFVSTVFLGIS